jgi:hypothetical protein
MNRSICLTYFDLQGFPHVINLIDIFSFKLHIDLRLLCKETIQTIDSTEGWYSAFTVYGEETPRIMYVFVIGAEKLCLLWNFNFHHPGF